MGSEFLAVLAAMIVSVTGGTLSTVLARSVRHLTLGRSIGPFRFEATIPAGFARRTDINDLRVKVASTVEALEAAAADSSAVLNEIQVAIEDRRKALDQLTSVVTELEAKECNTRQRIEALNEATPEAIGALMAMVDDREAGSKERTRRANKLQWLFFAVGLLWTLAVTAVSVVVTLALTAK